MEGPGKGSILGSCRDGAPPFPTRNLLQISPSIESKGRSLNIDRLNDQSQARYYAVPNAPGADGPRTVEQTPWGRSESSVTSQPGTWAGLH
jgi:hypothetical protein